MIGMRAESGFRVEKNKNCCNIIFWKIESFQISMDTSIIKWNYIPKYYGI